MHVLILGAQVPSIDSTVLDTPRSLHQSKEIDSAVYPTPGSLFPISFTQQSIHTGLR